MVKLLELHQVVRYLEDGPLLEVYTKKKYLENFEKRGREGQKTGVAPGPWPLARGAQPYTHTV